jgi:hypothetical protein
LQSWIGSINCYVSIKFQQNWSKQKIKLRILRSTNVLILFWIRKKCCNSGRTLLLYLFVKRMTEYTAVIIITSVRNITVTII